MKFSKMNTYITNTQVKKWNCSWPFRGLYVPHSYYSLFPSLEKSLSWDFLGGLVVRNPPAKAGGHGFDPICRRATYSGLGNHWSLHGLEFRLHSKRSHHNEQPAHLNEEQLPPAVTRKSPHSAKTQGSQKKQKQNPYKYTITLTSVLITFLLFKTIFIHFSIHS